MITSHHIGIIIDISYHITSPQSHPSFISSCVLLFGLKSIHDVTVCELCVVYTNIIWRAMIVFLTHCVHWSSERERESSREREGEKGEKRWSRNNNT
jgi:hypothetical protein